MASPEYFNAMAKGSHMLIRQGFLGKVYDAIHLGMRRQLQGTDDTALEESVQVRNLGILYLFSISMEDAYVVLTIYNTFPVVHARTVDIIFAVTL